MLTSAPGLSPVEVEKYLTFPVETAMNGLPGVDRDPLGQPHRGLGGHGDLPGRHRRLVRAPDGQRAAQAGRERHPARLRPPRAGPGVDGARRDLRVLSDVEAPHADGAAHAPRLGGRRSSCAPCPASSRSTAWAARPSSTRSSLDAKRLAALPAGAGRRRARSSSATTPSIGGGYIEKNRESFVIRGDAQYQTLEDIENTVITSDADGHAGADQERRAGEDRRRRCASARSPSTARARSSPAR